MQMTHRRMALAAAVLLLPHGAQAQPARTRTAGAAPMTRTLDALVREAATTSGFMGTVLVADRRRVRYQRHAGLANATWGMPVTADTRFRVASVTKQVSALLVMQEVQAGRLRLDGTVTDYLPWFSAGQQVTLEHLLTHVSGLRDLDEVPGYYALDDSTLRTHTDVVRRFLMTPPEWTPGTRFRYNNSDYVVLGAILEAVSGQSFDALLQARILGPLGMTNSGMVRERTVTPRLAAGYDVSATGALEAQDTPVERYLASGGMYSTATDLLKFYRAVDANRLLDSTSTARMFRPNDYGGALGSWQYDWRPAADSTAPGPQPAAVRIIERQGWIGPYRGLSVMIPSRGLFVIVIANGGHADLSTLSRGTGLASRLLAAVTAATTTPARD